MSKKVEEKLYAEFKASERAFHLFKKRLLKKSKIELVGIIEGMIMSGKKVE